MCLQSSLFMQNFYICFPFLKLLHIIVAIFGLNTKVLSYIAETPTCLASSSHFLKTKKELQKIYGRRHLMIQLIWIAKKNTMLRSF